MNATPKPEYYSIEKLFSSDKYIIPIYQRNYAWGVAEITQLIQDIVDSYIEYKKKPESDIDYFIGSLIVYEREKSIFETIDGQQRLTTLTILLILIKKEYTEYIDKPFYQSLNLSFASRPLSTKTLRYLFIGENTNDNDCNTAIIQGYEIAKKALKEILTSEKILNDNDSSSIKDFLSYLFEKVKILRVLVPVDTDLNHYFEIMNSRGEQLEKHERLKAKMSEILNEHDRYAFTLIWEACSNMEKYVQYGFEPKEDRSNIFGENWDALCSIDEIYKLNEDKQDASNSEEKQRKEQPTEISIIDLLDPEAKQFSETETNNEDRPERFNTIINFPNFLLHILRIQTKRNIPLDDKRLIESFEDSWKNQNEDEKKEFVKLFGYNLLKGKFLLDKYVIKREYAKGSDHWSLKRLERNDKDNVSYTDTFGKKDSDDDINNREILMLLSMFHVSTPTLVYKHWLNAALKYVFENSKKQEFSAQTYKEYLEELAKAFLYDRFLAKEAKDYFEIIYTNDGISKNTDIDIDKEKLNQGTSVENFIFNYLDYLLWQDYRTAEKTYFKGTFKENNEALINDKRIADFEYTFRSSVEHYYPQHPIGDNISIALTEDDREKNKTDWLNNFGNLCLISINDNSALSNDMPKAKRANHYDNTNKPIKSMKLRIMAEYEEWYINEIEQHGKKMKELLLNE